MSCSHSSRACLFVAWYKYKYNTSMDITCRLTPELSMQTCGQPPCHYLPHKVRRITFPVQPGLVAHPSSSRLLGGDWLSGENQSHPLMPWITPNATWSTQSRTLKNVANYTIHISSLAQWDAANFPTILQFGIVSSSNRCPSARSRFQLVSCSLEIVGAFEAKKN